MNTIFHRVSIRKYTDQPIEKEKIELLLKAAFAAPSARNQQPWEYYVVSDKEKIRQLADASPYTAPAGRAPVVFVPCYRTDIPAPEYPQIDLSASVENLLLEADELGLGAVWMGIAPIEDRMKKVEEILDIPEGLRAFALVSCGYPAENRIWKDRFDPSRVHYV